jgi:hypothetical protein
MQGIFNADYTVYFFISRGLIEDVGLRFIPEVLIRAGEGCQGLLIKDPYKILDVPDLQVSNEIN